MHCQKCNTELEPGKVYCPKCGHEQQIVPDYDPLDEVLWDGQQRREEAKKDAGVIGKESGNKKKKKSGNTYKITGWKDPVLRNLLLVSVGLILCITVACTAYLSVRRKNNYSYQLRQGLEYYENGQSQEAVSYLKRALELQTEDTKDDERPLLYMAKIYNASGDLELSKSLLVQLLEYPLGEKRKLEIYEELFWVIQEMGDSDEINEYIETCTDEIVYKRLQPYRIEKPTVNMHGGVYAHYIYPKLEAAYGTIYYTLDGSSPEKEGIPYSGRIELKEGDNILTAIAINEKGIVSEQLFEVYTLDFSE